MQRANGCCPGGAIRDEGLSQTRRDSKCAAVALLRVLRTVRLIPAPQTHSEVPEHRPRDGLFYHQWMHIQITMRARERAEHKGTACGYPLENVRCALQTLSMARIQGSLKYMLNISRHGVRHKKSTYLNCSDSALISSEKKKRNQSYRIVEHIKKYSSQRD